MKRSLAKPRFYIATIKFKKKHKMLAPSLNGIKTKQKVYKKLLIDGENKFYSTHPVSGHVKR